MTQAKSLQDSLLENGPEKIMDCLECKKDTRHKLVPLPKGEAGWRCKACGSVLLKYLREQVVAQVVSKVFGVPLVDYNGEPPVNIKVFLEHDHFGEAEVDHRDVVMHWNCTGELPVVGKPLMTKPRGANTHFMKVPYGKVKRVEI